MQITREQLRKIKRLPINEMSEWVQNFYLNAYEDGWQAGYAEGLTADLDGDEFIVMDEEEAKERMEKGEL